MKFTAAAISLSLITFLAGSRPASAGTDAGFVAKDADVDGVKLHYTTGGHGPAVILLHGFAETSRMWQPILPTLGEKFTVIAPDLSGIGDSSIPAKGINFMDAAKGIHALVRRWELPKPGWSGTTSV